jgi:ABC-2 type transport system ATP-binding protein
MSETGGVAGQATADGEAIRVSGLVKDYGATRAVDGAEFSVERGEIFSLLGPNGAGKTTTISILSCLARPGSGDAWVFGKSVTRQPMAVKASIGLVPQEIALYPDLSAQENLLFWGRMQGMRGARLRRRAAEVLDIVGLADRRRGRVVTFSGGMKRRVNIGVALMHEPALLILDEPTVGIDPQSRRHILDSIKELNRQGMTVLYTTHYMEEAQELSRHICIMDRGRVIARGTHDELVRTVGGLDRVEMAISGDAARAREAWKALDGVRAVSGEDGAVVLLVQDGNTTLPRLFETAARAGVRIQSVNVQEPNLEAVFMQLTGRALRDAGTP